MPQFDIYPNPGQKKLDIPYLVVIQNNHISSRTGTSVVIPLRANSQPAEIIYPLSFPRKLVCQGWPKIESLLEGMR